MPSYVVTGACPVEVDGVWREPGDHFATESDVSFLIGIGAVTLEGAPPIGATVVDEARQEADETAREGVRSRMARLHREDPA